MTMTRTELQQAIKTIRQTDGTAQTPALNSKTVVLQEWLDNYNETSARQQAALDEATPLFDEVDEVVPTETTELDEVTPLPQVDPITGRDLNWMPDMDEYEQYKANMMENCASAEYYPNGVVNYFDSERLYCVLPGYQEILNDRFYYEVVPVPTINNIADEMITEAKATDNYWINWNAAYYQAIDTLATKKHHVELVQFNDKWNTMIDSKTTAKNHSEVGLIVVLMVVEFLKLTAVLLSFTIVFTYSLVRRTAINHALIYDSFKSAVSVAKRTLQTA